MANSLSSSSSADIDLVEFLNKKEKGNLLNEYQKVRNTSRKDFYPKLQNVRKLHSDMLTVCIQREIFKDC